MLCIVGHDIRCGPVVSHRHGGYGGAVGLRQHANIPGEIWFLWLWTRGQSNLCDRKTGVHTLYVYCGVWYFGGNSLSIVLIQLLMFSGTISDRGKAKT